MLTVFYWIVLTLENALSMFSFGTPAVFAFFKTVASVGFMAGSGDPPASNYELTTNFGTSTNLLTPDSHHNILDSLEYNTCNIYFAELTLALLL